MTIGVGVGLCVTFALAIVTEPKIKLEVKRAALASFLVYIISYSKSWAQSSSFLLLGKLGWTYSKLSKRRAIN